MSTIPFLDDEPVAVLDLNGFAVKDAAFMGLSRHGKNPYILPNILAERLNCYHKRQGLAATYGSYGENRGFIWRQTYLDAMENPIHAGIDINVPAGSLVIADVDCEVVWVGTDHPEPHGWGNRIIVKLRGIDIWMIYAHLGAPICRVGNKMGSGSPIGYVGTPHENGGWYPHLHVQAMTRQAWEMFLADPSTIDGYYPAEQWPRKKLLFPFPGKFICIP
ncbi:MAG: peptidoglycan DD-metalloendopeptidase family protein [Candidatus Pacebacteria bacterium]|nr:peptidoglycan DD-metalloendopeptidase family protein [Candidatus Paceibacterota bacterium]